MTLDQFFVAFYLISTLLIGLALGRHITSMRDFSVSHRNYSTFVMVATLFATVIGGGSTCGIATNVYQYGLIFMVAFYGAVLNKILVARFVTPRVWKYQERISVGDIFYKIYGSYGRLTAGLIICFVNIAFLGQQITAIGLKK